MCSSSYSILSAAGIDTVGKTNSNTQTGWDGVIKSVCKICKQQAKWEAAWAISPWRKSRRGEENTHAGNTERNKWYVLLETDCIVTLALPWGILVCIRSCSVGWSSGGCVSEQYTVIVQTGVRGFLKSYYICFFTLSQIFLTLTHTNIHQTLHSVYLSIYLSVFFKHQCF